MVPWQRLIIDDAGCTHKKATSDRQATDLSIFINVFLWRFRVTLSPVNRLFKEPVLLIVISFRAPISHATGDVMRVSITSLTKHATPMPFFLWLVDTYFCLFYIFYIYVFLFDSYYFWFFFCIIINSNQYVMLHRSRRVPVYNRLDVPRFSDTEIQITCDDTPQNVFIINDIFDAQKALDYVKTLLSLHKCM